MKTQPNCIPCISKLIDSTLLNLDLPESEVKDLAKMASTELFRSDPALPPASIAGEIYNKILQKTNQPDLFSSYKENSIQNALELYPLLKETVARAEDKVEAAIRISALGNILDISNPNQYDLNIEVKNILDYPLLGDSLQVFKSELHQTRSLLILADNAGETVFDRVLIETIDIPVIYAVKGSAAFDDAVYEDAVLSGVTSCATVVSSGTSYPGTYLPSCSDEFVTQFNNAELVLSKGQGNFETLNEVDRTIFFLLKTKCEVVSGEIGFPIGSLVLKKYN